MREEPWIPRAHTTVKALESPQVDPVAPPSGRNEWIDPAVPKIKTYPMRVVKCWESDLATTKDVASDGVRWRR